MIDYNISVYLAEKRFRRRLKSIAKRKKRRKKGILEFDKNRLYLLAAKKIKSYEDALVVFLPRNLSYLVYDTKEPAPGIQDAFLSHPELNISAVARRMGIQQSLLASYIKGTKTPSPERKKLILDTIHDIGSSLQAVSF